MAFGFVVSEVFFHSMANAVKWKNTVTFHIVKLINGYLKAIQKHVSIGAF